MKKLPAFFVLLLLLAPSFLTARIMEAWSYQKLLERSDLVVIATPAVTRDTQEQIDLPGYTAMRAIGLETDLKISAVLKGDPALRQLVLHHYRPAKPNEPTFNGPTLVSFDPSKPRTFLIFLTREADGRYAPTGGQTDPGLFAVHAIDSHL